MKFTWNPQSHHLLTSVPASKNVLARVKSDYSLKYPITRNWSERTCLWALGSCKKSQTFFPTWMWSFALRLVLPGCSHHNRWQTYVFSKYPMFVVYHLFLLSICPVRIFLTCQSYYKNHCPSLTHWCATQTHSWLVYRERQTLFIEHKTELRVFLRGLHHKHEIDVLYTQDRHKSPSRERFSCSLYLHSSSIQQCLSHAVHKGF